MTSGVAHRKFGIFYKKRHCAAYNLLILISETVHKNPKNKPGFRELGSVTPYDLAVQRGRFDIAELIMEKVQEEKINGSCEYTCPPLKNNPEVSNKCYQADLLKGEILE